MHVWWIVLPGNFRTSISIVKGSSIEAKWLEFGYHCMVFLVVSASSSFTVATP